MRRTLLAVGVVALLVMGLYGCAGMQDDASFQQQAADLMGQQADTKVTGPEGEVTITEETDAATGAGAEMPKRGKHFDMFKDACFVEKAFWNSFDKPDIFSFAVFNAAAFGNGLDSIADVLGAEVTTGPIAAYAAVASDFDSDYDKPFVGVYATDMDSDTDKVRFFAFFYNGELGQEKLKMIGDKLFFDTDGDFQYDFDKVVTDGVERGYFYLFSDIDAAAFAEYKGEFFDKAKATFSDSDQDFACSYFPFFKYDMIASIGKFRDKHMDMDATAFFSFKDAFAKSFTRAAWSDRSFAKMDSDAAFDFDMVVATRGFFVDKKAAVAFSGWYDRKWDKPMLVDIDYYDFDYDYDIIKKFYDRAFAVATFGRFFSAAKDAGDVQLQQIAPAAGERMTD
jgi:hypothetical protein